MHSQGKLVVPDDAASEIAEELENKLKVKLADLPEDEQKNLKSEADSSGVDEDDAQKKIKDHIKSEIEKRNPQDQQSQQSSSARQQADETVEENLDKGAAEKVEDAEDKVHDDDNVTPEQEDQINQELQRLVGNYGSFLKGLPEYNPDNPEPGIYAEKDGGNVSVIKIIIDTGKDKRPSMLRKTTYRNNASLQFQKNLLQAGITNQDNINIGLGTGRFFQPEGHDTFFAEYSMTKSILDTHYEHILMQDISSMKK